MNRAEIARYLAEPVPPMPSYSRLRQNEPHDYQELVSFLANLR